MVQTSRRASCVMKAKRPKGKKGRKFSSDSSERSVMLSSLHRIQQFAETFHGKSYINNHHLGKFKRGKDTSSYSFYETVSQLRSLKYLF